MDAVAASLAEMDVPILTVWIIAAMALALAVVFIRRAAVRWLTGVSITLLAAGWTFQHLLTL